jgi:hypothetical protein
LRCLILPLAVTLNRFFSPLWVFCFGMSHTAGSSGRYATRGEKSHYSGGKPSWAMADVTGRLGPRS